MCTLFNSGCEFQSKFVFASLALHNAKTFVSFICFIKKNNGSSPPEKDSFIGLTPSFALIYISVEPAVTQNCVPLLHTFEARVVV